VLFFFRESGVVTVHSLMSRFGYSYQGAKKRIYLLHKEKLIEPLLEEGTWGITRKGEERSNYYERK